MANPKSIAQNTTYLTISFVFQKILSFIYFTLIARLIGVEGTGIYVFAISYTTIFSVFIDLGLSPVLTRESARNKEQSEKYLANILGLKIILSFFILLAVLTSINLVGKPPLTRLMVYLASALMVLDSFTLSFWALFRGWQNFFYEAKSVVFTQIIIVTVGITGILLKFPLYVLVIALISGSVFNFSYSLILLKKNLTIKPRLEFDKKTVRFLLTIAIPFALAGIFTRFYSYLDQVLLSF
ncbi:MAG TPA: oligosaccharide flippase family protein, partial [Patescibacteria group bacterium]